MSTRIHDLGYRAYAGERAGVRWAVRSLAVHSARRALGIKRPLRHKIAPVLTIAIAFVPAVVLAGMGAFLGGEIVNELIGYSDYFDLTGFAIFLFAAIVAPGVITTDRVDGMLALYLASPLNRSTYVLAKALAIFAVMLMVSAAPMVFLVLGYTLAGAGPTWPLEAAGLFGRALLAGGLVAMLFTGVAMFISSIPKRWSIASVSIVGFFVIAGIVLIGLTEGTDVPDWIVLASPGDVTIRAAQHIMGDPPRTAEALENQSGPVLVALALLYGVASLAATWWRYQRIEVDR